jgi:hypothetical protein
VQLDNVCRRIEWDIGIGGVVLLLSVWSWELLPLGRPNVLPYQPWDDHITRCGSPLVQVGRGIGDDGQYQYHVQAAH